MFDSSLWSACKLTYKYELVLSYRQLSEVLNPILFFIIVLSLFPLALTPDPLMLTNLAPGLIWIIALLSSLLALDRLFKTEYLDGSLEQLLLSPRPLTLLIFIKLTAQWTLSGVPLVLFSPLMGIFFHLSGHAILILMISLLLGTPVLIFIGAIGKALTLQVSANNLLILILILPLYIPVLIFGAGSVMLAAQGINVGGQLSLLAALLILTLPLASWATSAALRIGIF